MPLFKLSHKERTRLTMFFSSLLVAVFAWLFFSLSNRYEYKLNAKINYVDPPFHKAYRPLHDDTLSIMIEGTGWQLLFSRLRMKRPVIDVSLKALNNDSFITLSNQRRNINQQLDPGQRILAFTPDTLFFDFSKRVTKKVPVIVVKRFSFEPLFGISGPLKITPDSVMISGSPEEIKTVENWKTEPLIYRDINRSIQAEVNLRSPENNIEVIPKQVKVEVPVDEFTEKVIDVPLKILNSQGNDITLLPENVEVTFLVPLTKYPKVEKDSFEATVDFTGWLNHRYSQLPVSFSRFPSYSRLIKVEPQAVDFIIQDND